MSLNLKKKSIADIDVKGKRVLMRVDFNVPQDKKTGAITNTQRIVGAMPTIKCALEGGAKAVILMSHLGRPDGKVVESMTLKPVADKLGELMGKPVTFLSGCVGEEVEKACADPAEGSLIVLENLRFHLEEEGKVKTKDAEGNETETKATEADVAKFRESRGKLGDVYVNDAFGTAHRAHSSMVGMQGKMPCVAGLLVQKELSAFQQVLDKDQVQRPLTAIVGGAKIRDKVLVIENLIDQADKVVLCGGMAYTFMKVCHGMNIGKSLFDKKGAELAPKLLEKAKDASGAIRTRDQLRLGLAPSGRIAEGPSPCGAGGSAVPVSLRCQCPCGAGVPAVLASVLVLVHWCCRCRCRCRWLQDGGAGVGAARLWCGSHRPTLSAVRTDSRDGLDGRPPPLS